MANQKQTEISVTQYVNKSVLADRLKQMVASIRKLMSFKHSDSSFFQCWVAEAIQALRAEFERIRPQIELYLRTAK